MDFHDLHRGDRPLVLPNAWDFASGAALAKAGFPAVGTTSLGVAAAAGKTDATGGTREETLAFARVLSRLPVPVHRLSTGSLLFRQALQATVTAALGVTGDGGDRPAPSYGDVQRLVEH